MQFQSLLSKEKDALGFDYDYESIVPSPNGHASSGLIQRRQQLSRRRTVLKYLALISLNLLFFLVYHCTREPLIDAHTRTVQAYAETLLEAELTNEERSKSLPSYGRYYEAEHNLPQHDPSLPFPEGEDGRYLWVSNQHWGWNNIFQPLYMMALTAYLTNRAFVFESYNWDVIVKGPVAHYGTNSIPSRIPLTALINGPMAGSSFPPGDRTPRAVNEEYFNKVCPYDKRKQVWIAEINRGLESRPLQDYLRKYVKFLNERPEGCIELYGGIDHPFDWTQFAGESLVEAVYQQLYESPLLRFFSWSPLILSALPTNAALLSPSFAPSSLTPSPSQYHLSRPSLPDSLSSQASNAADALPDNASDLLVMHVRRGDYDLHCTLLANMSARFMGWNSVPGLANGFIPPTASAYHVEVPSPDGTGVLTDEELNVTLLETMSEGEKQAIHERWAMEDEGRKKDSARVAEELEKERERLWSQDGVNVTEVYRERCFPTIEEIVARTMEAKNAWEGWDHRLAPPQFQSQSRVRDSGETAAKIRRVYIATNGKREWVEELKAALWEASAEWESVASSRDIELTDEQHYVSQAVDMAIAERAAVFIGNGFSSMTSNINLLRRIKGHPLVSSWFW